MILLVLLVGLYAKQNKSHSEYFYLWAFDFIRTKTHLLKVLFHSLDSQLENDQKPLFSSFLLNELLWHLNEKSKYDIDRKEAILLSHFWKQSKLF